MDKRQARLKRARKGRLHMRELGVHRLTVHRTPRHVYAQVLSPSGSDVIASASTLEKDQRGEFGGNVKGAAKIGKLIAERSLAAGVKRVAFDRSGYKYHGRIKALADSAREAGMEM